MKSSNAISENSSVRSCHHDSPDLTTASTPTRSSNDLERGEVTSAEQSGSSSPLPPATKEEATIATCLFSCKGISEQRNVFLRNFLTMMLLSTAVMWACLCLLWGTNANIQDLVSTLEIQVVNFDQEAPDMATTVGNALSDALLRRQRPQAFHLTYTAINAASVYVNGVEDVLSAVGTLSGPWAAIVVESNTTSSITTASGAPAIGLYYASARSHQAVLGTLLPLLESDLHVAIGEAVQAMLSSRACDASALPLTMGLLTKGLTWERHDVRPITTWAPFLSLSTGLVWLVSSHARRNEKSAG